MKKVIFIITILILSCSISAQDYFDPLFDTIPKVRREGLPIISFENDNQFMMRAFYPEFYNNERQIGRDIRWVNRNDSEFVETWNQYGDSILALIEDFSGISWYEPEIEIRLLKYLRRAGLYEPLSIPLQGIKMENYTEAVPSGLHQLLNLIKMLSGRSLMQMNFSGHQMHYLSNHPLLENTAYRFDVIALILAIACAEYIIPPDSLELILKTEHWRRHNPGYELFENHFRYAWILSIDSPLVTYLAEEPYNSALVELTRPPRIIKKDVDDKKEVEPIKLAAGVGKLGFSVIKTSRGYLEVVDVDSLGLVFHCGLMTGDKIKRVNGEYARNARDLMSKILDKIDTDGVYLIVLRENEEIGLLLQPREQEYYYEDEYYETTEPEDDNY